MKKARLFKKVFRLVVPIWIVVVMLAWSYTEAAPAPSSKTAVPRNGGTLRFGAAGATATVGNIGFPATFSMGFAIAAYPAIETLFRCDKAGKPVPWLATGYKQDAAAKTVTITLRKGVKFHDGTDFNAEAVKFNLELCRSKKTGGTERFKSIDVIDDYTVRISLTEWDSTVVSSFMTPLGMMISPTAYKKNSEDWCISHAVGTGPFKFVSWQKDDRILYDKFDNYWQKGKPHLDRIEIIFIADEMARLIALRKGEIDLIADVDITEARDLEKEGFVIRAGETGSGCISLAPSAANPNSPWAKLKVRQAAQHAIDTEAIGTALFGRYSSGSINQFAHKGALGYNPSVVGYPYNPKKAKQLLAEAGYPNGFKTKIIYTSGTSTSRPPMMVQGYLKAVGIDAEMEPVLQAGWTQMALGGGTWEGLIHAAYTPNPDTAAGLALRYAGGGHYYVSMYYPDEYLQAIRKAVSAPDLKTKEKWTKEAMRLMIDKYCILLPVVYYKILTVNHAYVQDWGLGDVPLTMQWRPEDAWLNK